MDAHMYLLTHGQAFRNTQTPQKVADIVCYSAKRTKTKKTKKPNERVLALVE